MMWDDPPVSSIRRATSNPVRPGICTSRNTSSGRRRSIAVRAYRPLPAWPTISTPPIWPSRYPSSSRANCSSSTSTARKSILRRHPFMDGQLGDFDARRRPEPGHARQLQLVIRPINRLEPFVDVAQPDAAVERLVQTLLRHPQAVVMHFDDHVGVAQPRPDRDAPPADLARQAVLDRVLDERLQEHARHDHVEGVGSDLFLDPQLRSEPDDFNVEVLVDRLQLFAQRDEVIRAAHEAPEQT